MGTKYYVDANGVYIGAFATTEIDGKVFTAEPPEGSIEVQEPPHHASQPWLGDRWCEVHGEDV